MRQIFWGVAVLCCCAPCFAADAPSATKGLMTDNISIPAIGQEDYPQPAIPQSMPVTPSPAPEDVVMGVLDAREKDDAPNALNTPPLNAPPDEKTATDTEDSDAVDYSTLRQRVVILHGIGRSSASMRKVAQAVRHAGMDDRNIGYDSTRDVLATSIDSVYRRIRHFSDKNDEVTHFICYSLGCLVTRGIIEQHRPAMLGRVVMLGPPNQGSELADYLKNHVVSTWILGENLPQLGTGNRRNLEKLIGTQADYELGIIAGKDALDPVSAAILPDPNDGRVPVERTKLPGMKQHIVVDANHTSLIMDDAVIAQAVTFIQTGTFTYDATH